MENVFTQSGEYNFYFFFIPAFEKKIPTEFKSLANKLVQKLLHIIDRTLKKHLE